MNPVDLEGAEATCVVRRALADDAQRMTQLSGVLGYEASEVEFAARLRHVLACEEELVLVAVADAGVVGWIHGGEQTPLTSARGAEILGLVVDASYRHRGAGRRLVAAFESWASSRGATHLTVRSNIIRPESHGFYERLGYTRTKTQHVYRKPSPAHSSITGPRTSTGKP